MDFKNQTISECIHNLLIHSVGYSQFYRSFPFTWSRNLMFFQFTKMNYYDSVWKLCKNIMWKFFLRFYNHMILLTFCITIWNSAGPSWKKKVIKILSGIDLEGPEFEIMFGITFSFDIQSVFLSDLDSS